MDVSFFQEILNKISERGRQILDLPSLIGAGGQETSKASVRRLCRVGARPRAWRWREGFWIVTRRQTRRRRMRSLPFSQATSSRASRDQEGGKRLSVNPAPETLERLAMSVEFPWQELLRSLNLAPRRNLGPGSHAKRPHCTAEDIRASKASTGFHPSFQLLVQPGLPRACANVLVEPGLHPGKDHRV